MSAEPGHAGHVGEQAVHGQVGVARASGSRTRIWSGSKLTRAPRSAKRARASRGSVGSRPRHSVQASVPSPSPAASNRLRPEAGAGGQRDRGALPRQGPGWPGGQVYRARVAGWRNAPSPGPAAARPQAVPAATPASPRAGGAATTKPARAPPDRQRARRAGATRTGGEPTCARPEPAGRRTGPGDGEHSLAVCEKQAVAARSGRAVPRPCALRRGHA